MYMSMPKKWTIASARQQLPALIRSAAREPQRIYRRNTHVATVVSPDVAERIGGSGRKRSLADAVAELQAVCAEEQYDLEIPARASRRTPRLGAGPTKRTAKRSRG